MKKFIVLFLCLLTIPIIAIQVSGNQSGTWTSENNPYEVVGEITVPANQTLTVESGVNVIINGAYEITVEGIIAVNGTETDSVRFEREENVTDFWGGIRLESEGTGFHNTFNYCFIEGAENAIHSINSPVQVYNSRLTNNETAIDLFAIGATTPANVHIAGNLIEYSVMSGIELTENSNVLIENNEISYNGTGSQYRGAIQISAQTGGAVCSPVITNNLITNNFKQGVTSVDMFGNVTLNATIEDNEISHNLTGVYFYNAGGNLINNEIVDNFIAGDANSGAGVMCYGSRAIPYISRNLFEGNFTGVYVTAGAFPNLGDLSDSVNPIQGLNTFGDNFDMTNNNNSVYVNQTSGGQIMAQNNYWISDDSTVISQTIHDGNDIAGMSIVVFDPIATGNEPQVVLTVNLNLDPNLYDVVYGVIVSLDDMNSQTETIEESTIFYISGLPEGSYFGYCQAYNYDDGVVGMGVYGTQLEPTIFTVTPDMETLEITINVEDDFLPPFLAVGEVSNQFSIPSYKFITGLNYIAEPYYQYFYQDGDYLSIAGESVWSNGWENNEYNVEENKFFKTLNTQVGNTWQMIEDYDSISGATYQDAEIDRQETLDVLGTPRVANVIVTETDDAIEEYYLVEGVGLASIREYYDNYFGFGIDLIDANITADDTTLPLISGNIWFYDRVEGETHPWNLREDNGYVRWDAPILDGQEFTGYRIYNDLFGTEEVDFSEREYMIPIPIGRPTFEISVTAFNNTYETEHSNTIIVSYEAADDNTQPTLLKTSLNGNYPNPFNPETTISFTISKDNENAKISIYNLKGELVNIIANEVFTQGEHSIVWNGRDRNEQAVASGVYFYRLETSNVTSTKKMILMK